MENTRSVLILGKNYSTAIGVVRALGAAGYDVNLLFVASKKGESAIVAHSKYIHRFQEIVGRDDNHIVAEINMRFGNAAEKSLLLATDDYSAYLMDTYQDELKQNFVFPYMQGHSILACMDR